MNRRVAWLIAGAIVQVALAAVFLVVERGRTPEAPFLSETLDVAAPQWAFVGPRGPREAPAGRVVVHFWATWCGPCQTELPALLAAAESEGVTLVAATDEPWPVVERWFGGAVPEAIVHDPEGASRVAYGVSGLPDTFVVDGGRIVARVGGPRAWDAASARAFLSGVGR